MSTLKLDYILVENYDVDTYYKNLGADDPQGSVLLPGGETITITLGTAKLPGYGNYVTLYNNKLSDCQILLDQYGHVQDKDKMVLKIIGIEQTDESPIVRLTVQVPDASDVDKHFTKLGVQVPINEELDEYYIISHRVQVI